MVPARRNGESGLLGYSVLFYTLLRTGKSGLELSVKLSNWITTTAAAAADQ